MSEVIESTWIRLECLPLPDSVLEGFVVYWNPDTAELVGESSDLLHELVDDALKAGHLKGSSLSHFEITDPLTKLSELAAVLAQHFWVIPQPVESPEADMYSELKNLQ